MMMMGEINQENAEPKTAMGELIQDVQRLRALNTHYNLYKTKALLHSIWAKVFKEYQRAAH